jgi:pathogenesis-related protein 1
LLLAQEDTAVPKLNAVLSPLLAGLALLATAFQTQAATLTLQGDPAAVEGGAAIKATVTLIEKAAASVVVPLVSSNAAVAAVPASITIPAGAVSGSFLIQVTPKPVAATFTITAAISTRAESTKVQRSVKVLLPAAVAAAAVAPGALIGGNAATLAVTLSRPAAYPGVTVGLSSNSAGQITHPARLVISPGKNAGSAAIATRAVAVPLNVVVTAAVAGANALAASLTLNPVPAAAPPPPAAGTGEPAALAGITAAHNQVRAGVGVAPLTWSATLAATAQQWANACTDREPPAGFIDHNADRSTGHPYYVGENLFASSGPATAAAAVAAWASEAANYNYAANSCAGVCGHYTQVVWNTTREVGCAIAACPSLAFGNVIVCDYGPGGNVNGARPY